MPAPGALARRPGHLMFRSLGQPLGASDKLRERHFKSRRELDEVPIAWVPQPALDLADVGPVHASKIGQPLLRETVDFVAPRPNRIAKSL